MKGDIKILSVLVTGHWQNEVKNEYFNTTFKKWLKSLNDKGGICSKNVTVKIIQVDRSLSQKAFKKNLLNIKKEFKPDIYIHFNYAIKVSEDILSIFLQNNCIVISDYISQKILKNKRYILFELPRTYNFYKNVFLLSQELKKKNIILMHFNSLDYKNIKKEFKSFGSNNKIINLNLNKSLKNINSIKDIKSMEFYKKTKLILEVQFYF